MTPQAFEKVMKATAGMLSDPTEILTKVGFIVEGAAKQRTPVDTGTLRRSITSRVEGNAAYVGSAVVYAPFVHNGTRFMAGRPFLEEGIEDSRSRIEGYLSEFGGKLFEKVAQG